MNELVVFSHLRWDFVYQRPQQILSRLARTFRVLFVEEPVYCAGAPRADLSTPCHNVSVLTPHTPLTAPGFHDDQIPVLTKLVGRALARERFADYGAWLYTPMALPLLTKLSPRVVVYDCIDELAAFRSAPRQLVQRENALMRIANVVFAAGPSLYEARRARHRNVHLFPSSVDREHFARGNDAQTAPPEVKALARPRLGYCGVLDERLDLALLRGVAQSRPEWEFCMVGPVARIDPATLPHAPNLHYYGQRRYDELPAFLAGLDVALLPFARNEAPRQERLAAMRRIVASTSWDETARAMRRIVEDAATRGLSEAARLMLEPRKPGRSAVAARAAPAGAACLVIGAGPTGLSTAYHYGEGALVLEREARVGGGCRSIEDTGFTFDRAGHVMFSDDPDVQDLYRLLLGDNVHWQACDAWIYRNGAYVRYPFGGASATMEATWPLGRDRVATVEDASSTPREPGTSARFGYPLRGGFQALMNGFLPLLRGDLVLRASVERVSPLLRTVTLRDGRRFRYDTLVSTMPLPLLIAAIGDEAPAEVRRAAGELRHGSIRCVNLGVARPHLADRHWIDFPEGAVFRRIFLQGNASPHCNPPGGFGLTCEIAYSAAKPLPATGAALVQRCVRDCVRVGLLDASDALLTSNQVDIPFACVMDDDGRADRVAKISAWLASFDIVLAGRYGEWQSCDAEHAFVAGRKAAEAARRSSGARMAAKSA